MRNLFETKKVTEVMLYSENKKDVKITMTDFKCFLIKQYDPTLNYWCTTFETSSTCDWEKALNLAKSLIK